MSEPVRLLIWDLDETFWQGTLTEGGVDREKTAGHIVSELNRRGILSSICSKNDLEQTRKVLEALDVWDEFIFPSINWQSKGPRVAEIIEKAQLRPETVMFIDDNPTNREEVRQLCPGVRVVDEGFVSSILESELFVGKADEEKLRLQHYKVQEKKHADKEHSSAHSNNDYDFLRQSGIRVELIYELKGHEERIVELLNRTNQLNFTKKRFSEDKMEAEYDVERLIQDSGIFNHLALVKVRDNYGDYGVVGFFHVVQNVTDNFLVHFCFSCRILGMRIETWLYRYLGSPALEIVGEVANNPIKDTAPVDWVTLVHSSEEDEKTEEALSYPILMGGGCDIDSVRHYVKDCSNSITVITNTVRNNFLIRRDHSSLVRIGVEDRELDKRSLKRCGYKDEDFYPSLQFLEEQEWGLVVFSFWADAGFQIFKLPQSDQTAVYCPPQVAYGNFQEFYEEDFLRMGGPPSERHHFRYAKANLRPLGVIDEKRHKENIRAILSRVPKHCDVVLFTLPSKVPDLYPGSGILERHAEISWWQFEVSEEFSNVRCVNFDSFIHDPADAHTYDHFGRVVYLRAGQYLKKIYQEKTEKLRARAVGESE